MKKMIGSIIVIIAIVLCSLTAQDVKKVSAESTDIYQVNGKYTLTSKKLITKCELDTAASTLKKKTRVYHITSKTRFYTVNSDYSKKLLKGSKLKKAIKTANKRNVTIQFKERKGNVLFIWFI